MRRKNANITIHNYIYSGQCTMHTSKFVSDNRKYTTWGT